MNKVGIKLWDDCYLPKKKHTDDACYDCYVRLKGVTKIEISSRKGAKYVKEKDEDSTFFQLFPGERAKIPLGFALAMPAWLEAQIRPRSGLSSESKDSHFGTIDSNYRGEVKAIFENATSEPIVVSEQMRLAQMAIREIPSSARKQYILKKHKYHLKADDLSNVDVLVQVLNTISDVFNEILDNEIKFEIKDELDDTERGAKGFGSSGV